jgi:hypothetical protein
MSRRLTWLLALAAVIALAVAPAGLAGSKKGYKVSRGATTVALDPALATTLSGAGVTVTANKPAKAGDTVGQFKFPITNGRALASTTDGTITVTSASLKHVGGLTLTQGEKSLTLRNPWVAVTPSGGKLTAQIAGKRYDVATVEGGDVALTITGKRNRSVAVTGVTLKLTKAAADALVATFGLDPATVAEGATLGTATVATRIVGKGPKGTPAKPAKPAKPTTGKGHTHA